MNLSQALIVTLSVFTLTGCASTMSEFSTWMKGKDEPEKVSDKAAPAEMIKEATKPRTPFVLSAYSTGPIVQFTLSNRGSRAYPVAPDDFALAITNTRRIVRYDPNSVTLEINPWPDSIHPGETVSGRAQFHEYPDAVGHRLVFNPKSGTPAEAAFAPILSPSASSLRAPRVDPKITPLSQ